MSGCQHLQAKRALRFNEEAGPSTQVGNLEQVTEMMDGMDQNELRTLLDLATAKMDEVSQMTTGCTRKETQQESSRGTRSTRNRKKVQRMDVEHLGGDN